MVPATMAAMLLVLVGRRHRLGEANDSMFCCAVQWRAVEAVHARSRGNNEDDSRFVRLQTRPHGDSGKLDGMLGIDPEGFVAFLFFVEEEGADIRLEHTGTSDPDVGHTAFAKGGLDF